MEISICERQQRPRARAVVTPRPPCGPLNQRGPRGSLGPRAPERERERASASPTSQLVSTGGERLPAGGRGRSWGRLGGARCGPLALQLLMASIWAGRLRGPRARGSRVVLAEPTGDG